jgi:opacity protein-like surface antigen
MIFYISSVRLEFCITPLRGYSGAGGSLFFKVKLLTPEQDEMTVGKLILILFSVSLPIIAMAATCHGADNNYVVFKSGINLSQIGRSSGFKPGFNFGVAFGNLFSPDIATELEIGILQKKYIPPYQNNVKKSFDIIPLAWSFKKLVAFDKGEYYGLGGAGVYYVRERESEPGLPIRRNRETNLGFHAGAGLHYYIAQNTFLGAEGRYLFIPERALGIYRINGAMVSAFFGWRF